MQTRTGWLTVAGLAVFILGVGLAGGLPLAQAKEVAFDAQSLLVNGGLQNVFGNGPIVAGQDILAAEASVAGTITYQGRLTNPSGQGLNGVHSLRFLIYDAEVGGTAVWDSGDLNIMINEGLFKVGLGVNPSDFNGQALWLSIIVNGQTLSPRQSLLPVPYALSLRPGANVVGEPATASGAVLGAQMTGSFPNGKALLGLAPATGTAVYAQAAGGQGLFASSSGTYAVRGSSDQSWGGYFTSNQGHGIVVSTSGSDHWDHAGVFQAAGGYSLYAKSSGNMAIRGEAGDTTGLWTPVGAVGVVGIGQSRGLYGSGGSSYGVYGTSLNWYGIYGRTNRSDDNYGLYTPHNLFSKNINMAGAMMSVAQNSGDTPLETGDVVVFSGISDAGTGTPIIRVVPATTANSHAVAGVVYSRFNIAAVIDTGDDPPADMEITPTGAAQPGEYMLVVVHGPALVKASAVSGALQPGDLLSTAAAIGAAGKAEMVSLGEVEMALPGTILGKALEPLAAGQSLIYIFVTLQ
jgi:hypothetical protein